MMKPTRQERARGVALCRLVYISFLFPCLVSVVFFLTRGRALKLSRTREDPREQKRAKKNPHHLGEGLGLFLVLYYAVFFKLFNKSVFFSECVEVGAHFGALSTALGVLVLLEVLGKNARLCFLLVIVESALCLFFGHLFKSPFKMFLF